MTTTAEEDATASSIAGAGATLDSEDLRRLWEEHRGALRMYVLRLTRGNQALTEDLLQDTMLRLWRNPEAVTRSDGKIAGWLFRVAHNLVVDSWRARSVRPEAGGSHLDEVAGTIPVPDEAERRLTAIMVRQALARLPRQHREVLYLLYFRQLPVDEAARILEVPSGTVKSRAFYAVRALGRALERDGIGST